MTDQPDPFITDTNNNEAPYPYDLLDLVNELKYREWEFSLHHINRGQGSVGLTLDIVTLGRNAYHPEQGENYRVHHYMPIPPAAYGQRAWKRWLLDQILLVETHECCENFVIGAERPYAPNHGPGRNPYSITEVGTDQDRRTSFRGDIKPNDDI